MAYKKQSKQKNKNQAPRPEGQIRQSQVVTTFGPGAMVDLTDRAVVIGGLEHWGFGDRGAQSLDDPRLRSALIPRLKSLHPELELANENYFRVPPACDDRDPSLLAGVRALEFPHWFVCQNCRRLARAYDAFERHRDRYRHECTPKRYSHAVPVRFVAACESGHLTDFPWVAYSHPDGKCDRPELYLYEGATGDASRIRVLCSNCNAAPQPLSRAGVLPFPCDGHRPWLGGKAANEECDNDLKLMVRTASDAYFTQQVSALRLPEAETNPLQLKLEQPELWKLVRKVDSIAKLQMLADLQEAVERAIEGENLDTVVRAIGSIRDGVQATAARPLRTVEYERFAQAPEEEPGTLAPERALFVAYTVPPHRAKLPTGISRLVVVPELREVRVQTSFSRFASVHANLQGEYDFEGQKVKPACLTLPGGNEKWLPAAEVRGEGLFFELDPQQLAAWEQRPAVAQRAEMLLKAFEADSPGIDFPGIRFYLLHSLSHLLITAISLECGYAASAIRERIYSASAPPGHPVGEEGIMGGILLSTGTTGSEGTLGGLVEEGRRLTHHLRQAWALGRLCSNDPVCANHNPQSATDDRKLEGAACHGCLYIAECSCERFNRYLDRALVVPTIDQHADLAYFPTPPAAPAEPAEPS